MSSSPVRSLRLTPRNKSDLDRISGTKGEVFYDNTAKTLRVFDGVKTGGSLLNASVSVSDTAPTSPSQGSLWFNSSNGSLYLYYEDVDSKQWITPTSSSTSGGSGSGTVNSGLAGKLAYYPNNGTTVDDLSNIGWANGTLSVTGSLVVSAQKNYVRFHWDSLADLTAEVPPSTWHGMLAHAHDTGRVYVAHASQWLPLAYLSDVGSSSTALSQLTDVNLSSVADGQVLKYSSSQGKWIAAADLQATGGGGVALNSFSVSTATASGAGSLSYNNLTGVFTFTPAVGVAASNSFSTIAVAGQSNVVADSSTDTLTLVAGSNITITTNATTDTVTIAAAGGGTASDSFSTIAVAGQSNVVASSATDTLTLVAGSNITITTNATTDAITINASSGTSTLDNLSDVVITSPVLNQVLKYNGTNWINDVDATSGGAGVGTVTSVSVTSANGFAGSVATSSSTPAITISTSITGILKGNGTAISAAAAGTDYQAPITLTTTGTSGAATFSSGTLNIPQYTAGTATAFLADDGSATTPSYGLSNDSGTGIYRYANQFLGVATAGTARAYFNSTGLTLLSGGYILVGNGSATNASITFTNDTNTGLYSSSADILGVTAGGTQSALFRAGGTTSTSTTTGALTVDGGLGVTGAIYAGNIFSNGVQVGAGGATTFSGLTDSTTASLTVDKIYLPAITMLAVTNNGATSYSFDQYASTNPTIFAINGTTIAFNLSVAGHPFLIQTSGGANYNTGLVHVSTSGTVMTGASAQGQTSGTLYWKIPNGISGNYRYICQLHGAMVGTITIKDFSVI